LNPHLRELVLHARPHTAEVDRVHAVEDLGRFVGGVTRRNLDAGVVERHVQPAVGVDRGADGCGDAVLVGDVTFDAEDLVAVGGELACDGHEGVMVDVGEHDGGASVSECLDCSQAHTGAGAGDERHPAGEVVGRVHAMRS